MEELNASSPSNWLSNLEMDEYDLFPQGHELNFLDDGEFLSHDIMSALQGEPLPSSESNSSIDEMSFERPTKQMKTNNTDSSFNNSSIITTDINNDNNNNNNNNNNNHFSPSSSSLSASSPTSQILSFDSPATNTGFQGFDFALNPKQNGSSVSVALPQPAGNMDFSADLIQKGSTENKTVETRKPQGQGTKRHHANAQDHIMAERKRREKLSQSLIALAALIPGLKKMDKASVLGDAIKHVKELQERVRVLEEESNKRSLESVVIVNKPPQVSSDDDSSSCDESFEAGSGVSGGGGGVEAMPHVEARVADKEVLLRIHCQKHKGLYVKLLSEIQSLHLFVANSSVLPFGDSVLDITIVAQMGREYKLSIKDLVRSIRVATLKSMS